MKYALGLFMCLICACGSALYAQKPEPPMLYSVSVDPESGNTIIIWYSSVSADVDFYKVLELQPNLSGEVMMEISPSIPISANSYAITSDLPHSRSVGYAVVAVNDVGGGMEFRSGWDSPDSTMFLESSFDSCLATIALSWNDYNTWRGSIAEYNIYRYLDFGMYELVATLEEGTNSLEIDDILPNQTYDLFVEAVHEDGRRSTSNRTGIYTQMSQVPGFINADYATISPGNTINLAFTVDATAASSKYNLLRSNSFDGPFITIDSFSIMGPRIFYTDEVPFTSAVYYYRLEVINSCGIAAEQSNRANNIILNGTLANMVASLGWNEYRDWLGNVDQYRIIRTLGQDNPVTDTLDAGNANSFSDDVSQFINYADPTQGLVCYSVVATENTNTYGINGKSQSNPVCFSVNPGVQIPNAFIPNDTEPANQVFEPVFSFLPDHYEMYIYNRLGSKIWEGSQAWDGRVNGKFVPEGVYAYYIRVYNYSSDITEFSGKVTVLYR